MAKVNVKFEGVKQSITRILKSIGANAFMYRDVGEFVRKRIYSFTKRGIELKTGEKIPGLSESYIKRRKAIVANTTKEVSRKRKLLKNTNMSYSKKSAAEYFKNLKESQYAKLGLGPFFGPTKSNLTFSGQMLESLKYEIIPQKGLVIVGVPNTNRDGDDKTNAQVAEENRKGDASKNRPPRPFIGLDKKGQDRVRMMIVRELRRRLSRFR